MEINEKCGESMARLATCFPATAKYFPFDLRAQHFRRFSLDLRGENVKEN